MSSEQFDSFHRYSGEQPVVINHDPRESYTAFDQEKANRSLEVLGAQNANDSDALIIAREKLNALL